MSPKNDQKKLGKKHQLLCTTRNYREAKELAKIRKIDAIIVGRHGGSDKAGKLLATINRMKSLFTIIQKFKPELTLSLNSPDDARMAFGLGIKHSNLQVEAIIDSSNLNNSIMKSTISPKSIKFLEKLKMINYGE